MKFSFTLVLFLSLFISVPAQEVVVLLQNVPDSLKANADSVVLDDYTFIDIESRQKMVVSKRRIVTVLNKRGRGDVAAYEFYSPSTKINDIEAVIYDAQGQEIDRIKKRDFKDVSAVDGVSIFNDDRRLYLQYTPTSYPYTIAFTSKTTTSNTAFIDTWFPMRIRNSSVVQSVFEVAAPAALGLKYKARNTDIPNVTIEASEVFFSGEASYLTAYEYEYMSTGFSANVPSVIFGLDKFHLEGQDGEGDNWEVFGQWMQEALLSDTTKLSPEVIEEVQDLVAGIDSSIEKARAIYQYMQDRTRYVSIQMGIGGWKPMQAQDVHTLGYGDCKALTNYTKSLLEAVGVPSYYTILYGDSDLRHIDKEFTSLQGNHAILALPKEDGDYIWLECTSQKAPFGHIAGFTDNRDVLVVTDKGGEIVRTKVYGETANTLEINADFVLSQDGVLSGLSDLAASGLFYDQFERLDTLSEEEAREALLRFWDYINGISLDRLDIKKDKPSDKIGLNTEVSIANFYKKLNEEYIINPNILHKEREVPKRYRNREQAFQINRGHTEKDDFSIDLGGHFEVTYVPEPFVIESDFGVYKASVRLENGILHYSRIFTKKSGIYTPDQYKAYRTFMRKVVKADNTKIILKKSI